MILRRCPECWCEWSDPQGICPDEDLRCCEVCADYRRQQLHRDHPSAGCFDSTTRFLIPLNIGFVGIPEGTAELERLRRPDEDFRLPSPARTRLTKQTSTKVHPINRVALRVAPGDYS